MHDLPHLSVKCEKRLRRKNKIKWGGGHLFSLVCSISALTQELAVRCCNHKCIYDAVSRPLKLNVQPPTFHWHRDKSLEWALRSNDLTSQVSSWHIFFQALRAALHKTPLVSKEHTPTSPYACTELFPWLVSLLQCQAETCTHTCTDTIQPTDLSILPTQLL